MLVANGCVVVAREGDPLDLDGNGQYDDNAYINAFGNDAHIRLSYATSMEQIDLGLDRMERFLHANGA